MNYKFFSNLILSLEPGISAALLEYEIRSNGTALNDKIRQFKSTLPKNAMLRYFRPGTVLAELIQKHNLTGRDLELMSPDGDAKIERPEGADAASVPEGMSGTSEGGLTPLEALRGDLTIRLRDCLPTDVAELLDRIAQESRSPSLKEIMDYEYFSRLVISLQPRQSAALLAYEIRSTGTDLNKKIEQFESTLPNDTMLEKYFGPGTELATELAKLTQKLNSTSTPFADDATTKNPPNKSLDPEAKP